MCHSICHFRLSPRYMILSTMQTPRRPPLQFLKDLTKCTFSFKSMVNNLSNFYHEVDHSISLDKKNWMHLLLIYPNSLPLEHEFLGLKASTKIKKKKKLISKSSGPAALWYQTSGRQQSSNKNARNNSKVGSRRW